MQSTSCRPELVDAIDVQALTETATQLTRVKLDGRYLVLDGVDIDREQLQRKVDKVARALAVVVPSLHVQLATACLEPASTLKAVRQLNTVLVNTEAFAKLVFSLIRVVECWQTMNSTFPSQAVVNKCKVTTLMPLWRQSIACGDLENTRCELVERLFHTETQRQFYEFLRSHWDQTKVEADLTAAGWTGSLLAWEAAVLRGDSEDYKAEYLFRFLSSEPDLARLREILEANLPANRELGRLLAACAAYTVALTNADWIQTHRLFTAAGYDCSRYAGEDFSVSPNPIKETRDVFIGKRDVWIWKQDDRDGAGVFVWERQVFDPATGLWSQQKTPRARTVRRAKFGWPWEPRHTAMLHGMADALRAREIPRDAVAHNIK